MSKFVQFHLLTSYGLSNPNRDDQGRPKQAMIGGVPRLRLSSQSVKRAIRESDFFKVGLAGHMGVRSKCFYGGIRDHLVQKGVEEKKADEISLLVVGAFGSLSSNKKDPKKLGALAFVSPEEMARAIEVAEHESLLSSRSKSIDEDKVMLTVDGAVDIAMFGRMMAKTPRFNRDAAIQVSHAITTHRAQSEEDWFAAVDDLNSMGGHLDEAYFGSGIYYQYACLDCSALVKNLDGNIDLAVRGAEAFTRAIAMAAPKGKQNSFANRPRAHYILVEAGEQMPRDLSGAFFTPVSGGALLEDSVKILEKTRREIDVAYDLHPEDSRVMHVGQGGTLAEIVDLVTSSVRSA